MNLSLVINVKGVNFYDIDFYATEVDYSKGSYGDWYKLNYITDISVTNHSIGGGPEVEIKANMFMFEKIDKPVLSDGVNIYLQDYFADNDKFRFGEKSLFKEDKDGNNFWYNGSFIFKNERGRYKFKFITLKNPDNEFCEFIKLINKNLYQSCLFIED